MRLAALALAIPLLAPLRAEEGMWTYDNVPVRKIKAAYGFEPTQAWLDHLRLASVRVGDASGSFVSASGLVLTNHHVAFSYLQTLSSAAKDYVKDGFLARARAEEKPCPDLEMDVLESLEDVTSNVAAAVKPGMDPGAAQAARKAAIGRLEKESLDRTGLKSSVVELYQGGEYWLYRYRRFTDVRLVFAPEHQAASFGGDPDNFTYPRYNLDMALFRVYEGGKPYHPAHFLKWSGKGPAAGDLVFVSGNPYATERLDTHAQLEYRASTLLPLALRHRRRWLALARAYAARGPEEARQAGSTVYGLENGIKVRAGQLAGLQAPGILERKAREEKALRAQVEADPNLRAAYGSAWDDMAKAQALRKERAGVLAFRRFKYGHLADKAAILAQYAVETAKPDTERLEDFRDARLEALRFRLLSPAPVYPALEETFLADDLREAQEELGAADPWVKLALDGRAPEDAAKALLAGTRLADPAFCKALMDGGPKALAACEDPLILLARRLDPLARELRAWENAQVRSLEASAGERIARALFALRGKDLYPDATSSLRLGYGTVKGYAMNGTLAPVRTTFYGMYDRSAGFDGKPPFDLPQRFLERRDRLDLATPFNFVCEVDSTGGNSGSPIVDREGALVGLLFDGNIESLVGDLVYDSATNRTVAVDAAGMTEALEKLYDARFLVDDLEGRPAAR